MSSQAGARWCICVLRVSNLLLPTIFLWDCSDNMASFVFLLDFGTAPTVWNYLFFYWSLELFRQCAIICFYMGLWNCSDSVVLFVFLWDFGTVPTVWHYLFFFWTLELFHQCGIICFFYGSLELFRQCGIICFSIWLWKCSDSVALFVFLLDFDTVLTVWHYLFFCWTLELFWH